MNLLSLIGKKLGIVKGWSKWATIYGLDDSEDLVTAERALKLSTYWAGTRLTSETVATLPGGMYETTGADRKASPGHRMHELLHHRPNDEQTPVEFWEGRVAPLMLDGNSYAEIRFLGDNPVSLLPMPFPQVDPFRDETDDYRIKYRFTDRGKQETLPAAKVFHIKGFGIDDIKGLSPIGFARLSLSGSLALERSAGNVYRRGMRASGFFKTPKMDEAQRKEFIETYIKPMEGAGAEGKGTILPPMIEWQPTNINPKDAEMLLSRRFNVEDVCRWLGIPPILVGHAAEGQTMWGSGVEQIILGWLVLGLRAYLKRIESAVNTRLISLADRKNGFFWEFNFEGLLRADSAGRAALMQSLASNGLRTRDELRRLDNYPAMGGGAEKLTVQSAMMALDQIGAPRTNADAARNAIVAWLNEAKAEETRRAA